MKNLRTAIATGMTMLTVMASVVPSFAAINITDYSTVNVRGSAIETMIIDKNKDINAKGGDIKVLSGSEINAVNSYIDTLVDAGITNINVKGQNIDITTLDTATIMDSAVVNILQQKVNVINAQERLKAIRR